MKTIIIINGYPVSGKDTFVDMVKDYANDGGDVKVTSISSIAPVWKMLKEMGVPMDLKTNAERKLAADIKSAFEDYDFFSTRKTLQEAQQLLMLGAQTVFIHMREPRSIQWAKNAWTGPVKMHTLFVDRPSSRSREFSNAADREVENMRYTHYVANDGTLDELRSKAVCFAREVLWI